MRAGGEVRDISRGTKKEEKAAGEGKALVDDGNDEEQGKEGCEGGKGRWYIDHGHQRL